MFEEVIVPIDGSAASSLALRPASAVACYLGVAMRAVAFHSPQDDGFELTRVVQRQLSDIGDVTRKIEVSPMTRPVAELLKEIVDEAPESLLVMSTRGHGRSAALMGSVANDVLEVTHRPVMLIGPECDVARFRLHGPMVVPTDASACTRPALELAGAMTQTFDFDPVVVNVLDPAAARDLDLARKRGHDVAPESAMVERFAEDLGWATGHDGIDFQVLHDKHPGKAIAAYASERHATLVTMATHALSGLRRLALGSVTADVVAHAPCPVLAVAPDLS